MNSDGSLTTIELPEKIPAIKVIRLIVVEFQQESESGSLTAAFRGCEIGMAYFRRRPVHLFS